MARAQRIIDVTESTFDSLPCCGIKNPAHEGRQQKKCWLQKQFQNGLRAKMAVTAADEPCGYIEYLPGEYAWRGVAAHGYMFIHCVWTFSKRFQNKGVASALIQACLDDAKNSGMNGVAVLARAGPWLGGRGLFLKNGFEVVDAAPPDFQLLVKRLQKSAVNPSFKGGWDKKAQAYGPGLTIIRSAQCPHVAKFAGEIVQTATDEYGLKPKVIELKSCRDAQNAPTPYAVFSIIYDGRVVADHQVSRTRFRNIMKSLHI